MKTCITFIAALFLTVATYANYGVGRLNITSMTDCRLRVIVDGNKYDMSNALFLNNLQSGYHDVKIIEITRGWGRNRLVYSSSVFLRPDGQLNIAVNRSGEIAVAEQSARNGDYDRRNDHDGYGRRDDRDGRDGQSGYGHRDDHDGNGRTVNTGDRNTYPQGRNY